MFIPGEEISTGSRGLYHLGYCSKMLDYYTKKKKEVSNSFKEKKGTEVYLLEEGETEELWISKKVKII